MTKAKRQMLEDIKLIDLVIELVDARIPLSSRNPDIDQMAAGKSRLILMNKADMADQNVTAAWLEHFQKRDLLAVAINSLRQTDMKVIHEYVLQACRAKIERDQRRGIRNRPVRAMVTGIPNVGKSTFINTFSRKGAAKTGNRPGVTKGKQWVRLSNTLELLDTPGILWPKFEDPQAGLKLAMIGSIREEILNTEELAAELISLLGGLYPEAIPSYYSIDVTNEDTPAQILERIALQRGCLARGGEADLLRAANMLLENFRNGKMGRFTLERPEE